MPSSTIFTSDLAARTRAAFEEAIDDGLSPATATDRVFEEFGRELADPEQSDIIFLALAMLQMEQDALQLQLRGQALSIIERGEPSASLREAGLDAAGLQDLKRRMLAS